MSEKKARVPVYDTKSSKFQTVRQNTIENENFEVLKVPRFRRFDLYESNNTDPGQTSHSIVSNSKHSLAGSTLCARLNYGGLGLTSSVRRIFSKEYRMLRVGVLP
jgi:hypothetical protein